MARRSRSFNLEENLIRGAVELSAMGELVQPSCEHLRALRVIVFAWSQPVVFFTALLTMGKNTLSKRRLGFS
jgi:hypothetical protein